VSLFPWLVADIGGTNARFGLVHQPDAPVRDIEAMRCIDYATPEDAAEAYLSRLAQRLGSRPQPKRAAFALATAIHGDTVKMTNNNWVISRDAVEQRLGARPLLLNDFEVLGLALPTLADEDVDLFGGGTLDRKQPMAVIGPGTGLGVGSCIPVAGTWLALPGEGGHVTLAAADEFEATVLNVVRAQFAHVSAERLLSGIGMPILHKAVAQAQGRTARDLAPDEITRGAMQDKDPDCEATLATFCAMLGTFAGNVALTVGARGGVFVAGGIGQKLGPFLKASKFRARFDAKGRFTNYMKAIATGLLIAPHAALAGAAHAIANDVLAESRR